MSVSEIPKIHWNVRTRCNLTCDFCYLWRRPGQRELSSDVALSLVREAARHTGRFVFGGGDPLMRTDIVDLAREARSLGLAVELQTNAVGVATCDAVRLLPLLDRFGVSLDGENPAVHDRMRSAQGNFEQVLGALALADTYGVHTTVRTLVSRRNMGYIGGIGNILANHPSVRKWSLRQFAPLGRGEKTAIIHNIESTAFHGEVRRITSQYAGRRLDFEISAIDAETMEECFCLINEDGHVYGHPTDGNYYSVGRFPDESLSVILPRLAYDHTKRRAKDRLVVFGGPKHWHFAGEPS